MPRSKRKAVVIPQRFRSISPAEEQRLSTKCPQCKQVYVNKRTLRLHLQLHLNFGQLRCSFCESSFRYPYRRVEHVRRHHNDNYADYSASKRDYFPITLEQFLDPPQRERLLKQYLQNEEEMPPVLSPQRDAEPKKIKRSAARDHKTVNHVKAIRQPVGKKISPETVTREVASATGTWVRENVEKSTPMLRRRLATFKIPRTALKMFNIPQKAAAPKKKQQHSCFPECGKSYQQMHSLFRHWRDHHFEDINGQVFCKLCFRHFPDSVNDHYEIHKRVYIETGSPLLEHAESRSVIANGLSNTGRVVVSPGRKDGGKRPGKQVVSPKAKPFRGFHEAGPTSTRSQPGKCPNTLSTKNGQLNSSVEGNSHTNQVCAANPSGLIGQPCTKSGGLVSGVPKFIRAKIMRCGEQSFATPLTSQGEPDQSALERPNQPTGNLYENFGRPRIKLEKFGGEREIPTFFICDVVKECSRRFVDEEKFKRHCRLHKRITRSRCSSCKLPHFSHKPKSLCQSCKQRKAQGVQHPRKTLLLKIKESRQCFECLTNFDSEVKLKDHLNTAHVIRASYVCNICFYSADHPVEYHAHLLAHKFDRKHPSKCKQKNAQQSPSLVLSSKRKRHSLLMKARSVVARSKPLVAKVTAVKRDKNQLESMEIESPKCFPDFVNSPKLPPFDVPGETPLLVSSPVSLKPCWLSEQPSVAAPQTFRERTSCDRFAPLSSSNISVNNLNGTDWEEEIVDSTIAKDPLSLDSNGVSPHLENLNVTVIPVPSITVLKMEKIAGTQGFSNPETDNTYTDINTEESEAWIGFNGTIRPAVMTLMETEVIGVEENEICPLDPNITCTSSVSPIPSNMTEPNYNPSSEQTKENEIQQHVEVSSSTNDVLGSNTDVIESINDVEHSLEEEVIVQPPTEANTEHEIMGGTNASTFSVANTNNTISTCTVLPEPKVFKLKQSDLPPPLPKPDLPIQKSVKVTPAVLKSTAVSTPNIKRLAASDDGPTPMKKVLLSSSMLASSK